MNETIYKSFESIKQFIEEAAPMLSSMGDIVIIGGPATGKTFFSGVLPELPNHVTIHTDMYMEHGFEQSLYEMIKDMKAALALKSDTKFCIEGMLGARLLRKGVEQDFFYPEVVIEMESPDELIEKIYMDERLNNPGTSHDDPSTRLKRVHAMTKAQQTILAKYDDMPNKKPPSHWFQIQNVH